MRLKNLILSLHMMLGLVPTFFSTEIVKSLSALLPPHLRYEEVPKIVFLLVGVTLLMAGLSYLARYKRNAKGVCVTVVGMSIILAYFFALPH